MSVVTQIGGSDPNYLWALGALPMGLALDLALGDLPGRSYPVRWMNRLIEVVEGGARQTVSRLGGGRGGDLFGGLLLAFMVTGTASSLVWLAVNLADIIGGPVSLAVRAGVIAAGLMIRSTGDRILQAAEVTDRATAARWLEAAGGRPPRRLEQLGVDRVCVASVGELTSAVVVAPLFWLSAGGPAAMWGFLAIRSLRETMLARGDGADLAARVTVTAADLAEQIPAMLSWVFLTMAAGVLRFDLIRSCRLGWRAGFGQPRLVPVWGQGALAGALGVQILGGRVFADLPGEAHPWLGEATQVPDGLTVIRAVRIMQIASLLAAGLALLVSIVW